MELRHLRYFIAVAEEGSLTVAAEKRLHTAQPSLSRQMRDLELELGVTLMVRGARGIELTAAGRVFLDHARVALLQIEAAGEAARRAAQPVRTSFAVGFLTGFEMEWLAPVMAILREAEPAAELVIYSQPSPDLAAGLMRGKVDVAFLRPEKKVVGLTYVPMRREPLVVVMRGDHRLAVQDSVRPEQIVGETLIGVPVTSAPVLREVTDRYAAQVGVDLTPHHMVENLSMAIALVSSTRGVSLLPLYAQAMLPPSVVSRPLAGAPPVIDLVLGYSEANTSPLLKVLLSRVEALKEGVTGRQSG
jgi:LysR family transcriptional regulator, hca operon transcriptional activator